MKRDLRNLLVGVLLGAAGAISFSPGAEPYVVVGLGKGELTHPGSNKWWVQEGWGYTIDQKSTVWNIGAGWKISKYLSAEVNYHDLGEYHHFAGFMANEELYDPNSPTLCSGPCDPTQWGYLRGSVTAVSISILPRYPITKDLSVFARYGRAKISAKFTTYVAPADLAARHYTEGHGFSENITSEIFGVGFTYKRFSFEHQRIPTLIAQKQGCCSAYTEGENYTISYRWEFN